MYSEYSFFGFVLKNVLFDIIQLFLFTHLLFIFIKRCRIDAETRSLEDFFQRSTK